MKDFSMPPFDLKGIGDEVLKLGTRFGIKCVLCSNPALRALGGVSLPEVSQDIVNIAAHFGIHSERTCSLPQLGMQFQSLLVQLRSRNII